MSDARTVLIVGETLPFAPEIAAGLEAEGWEVALAPAAGVSFDALVIVAAPPVLAEPFVTISDESLVASLDRFLDVFELLNTVLPRLNDGGSVVMVSPRAHLGAWGGVHEAAFAGAAVGLFRSVTLENMSRGVRANLIAVELPGCGKPSDPGQVADLAAFLLSPRSAALNGETLLANGGRSLQLREGRDRRAQFPPKQGSAPRPEIPDPAGAALR